MEQDVHEFLTKDRPKRAHGSRNVTLQFVRQNERGPTASPIEIASTAKGAIVLEETRLVRTAHNTVELSVNSRALHEVCAMAAQKSCVALHP